MSIDSCHQDSVPRTASRFAPRIKLSEALNEEEVDKIKQLKFYAKRRSIIANNLKNADAKGGGASR